MDTVLLHPSYGCSIAQYAAIVKTKHIIWEVHDNFQKQTYRNRLQIATSSGLLRLSVPIIHLGKGLKQKSSDVKIDNKMHWQRDHWRSIKVAYLKSPFFEYYQDVFEAVFLKEQNDLFAIQNAMHAAVMECLDLTTTSTLSKSYTTSTTAINDKRALINAKKDTIQIPEYTQVFSCKTGFLPQVSVLDLIFNEGPNALNYLENLPNIG